MKGELHYWRCQEERPQFFRSASFVLTWKGLCKSIRHHMSERSINSIKLSPEGGDNSGKADVRTPGEAAAGE